jgi:hypothetical protein
MWFRSAKACGRPRDADLQALLKLYEYAGGRLRAIGDQGNTELPSPERMRRIRDFEKLTLNGLRATGGIEMILASTVCAASSARSWGPIRSTGVCFCSSTAAGTG